MSKQSKYGQYRICVESKNAKFSNSIKKINSEISHSARRKLYAAFQKSKIWPQNANINIYFFPIGVNDFRPIFTDLNVLSRNGDTAIDPIENEIQGMTPEDAVKVVLQKRIAPLVNLKFNFVTDPKKSQVRISFKDDGAWSLVGTDAKSETDFKKATMNLGWLDAATIIHEFGHLLGLIHEHQNPNGNQINWDIPEVYSWAKDTQGWDQQTTYHNIIEHYSHDELNGSEYDPYSVMLYFFPGALTTDNKSTLQNNLLSKTDYEWITKQYPGGDTSKFKGPLAGAGALEKFGNNTIYIVIGIGLIIAILAAMVIYFKVFKKKNKK